MLTPCVPMHVELLFTQAVIDTQVFHVDSTDEEIDETVLKFSLGYLHTGEVDSKGLYLNIYIS